MRSHPFGRTGTELPVIGQGTWKMERTHPDGARQAIQRGVELGMTHLDTAEMYADGRVEKFLGDEVLAPVRDRIVLVSKILPSHATLQGTLDACDRSLKRLRTDHLDGYLLHWPGEQPLEETIEAFERLVESGKIRWWGVSNFDVEGLEEVIRIAGPGRCACNQVPYHLRKRDIERDVLPFCEANDMAVVGYSPFATGRFVSTRSPRYQLLQQIGTAHGVSSYGVALAFLTRRPSLFSIPKAGMLRHALDNARAGRVVLTEEQVRQIEEAFPCEGDER